MTHNSVEPEVAGGLGANTVLDRSRHPPVVQRLHYEFEGWLGDVLLESFPALGGRRRRHLHDRASRRTQRHFRAFQDKRSEAFADGTLLVFGGGKIKMRADEWFTSKDVEAVFVGFLRGEPLPEHVRWRDISEVLA